MENVITFNDLPQVVAELRDEVIGMRQMLACLQKGNTVRKENTHRPMSVEDAAEYFIIRKSKCSRISKRKVHFTKRKV